MIKINKNNDGFSIMEALVASLIFSIGVVGVFSTMSSQKAPSVESDARVRAAFIGRQILDELRAKVDARTYNTGNLAVGSYGPFTVNGYSYNYIVSAAGEARKVDLNISW